MISAGHTSTRYRNFFHGVRKSPSYEGTVMANIASRDLRSTTGSNLRFVQESSGLGVQKARAEGAGAGNA